MGIIRVLRTLLSAFDTTMLGLGIVLPAYLIYNGQHMLAIKVNLLWLTTYVGSKYLLWRYHPGSPRNTSSED